jgi:hypothetical protein
MYCNGKNPGPYYRHGSLLQSGQHHRNITREDSELLEDLCEDGTIGQLGLGWNYLPLAEGESRDGPANEDENTVSVLFPTL